MKKDEICEKMPLVVWREMDKYDVCMDNLSAIMGIASEDDVNRVLSLVFGKLGFTKGDSITVSKVVDSAYDMVRLELTINDIDNYKVNIHRRYGEGIMGFSYTDKNGNAYNFKCFVSEPDKLILDAGDSLGIGNLNVIMIPKSYSISVGEKAILCEMSYGGITYSFSPTKNEDDKMSQLITVRVNCSEEDASENRARARAFRPENEEQLIDYFKNVDVPVQIDKVYKNIRDMAFFDDVSNWPLFSVNVYTTRSFDDTLGAKITDVIKLEMGRLVKFGMMHLGNYSVNEDNFDGAAVVFSEGGVIDYYGLSTNSGYFSLRNVTSKDIGLFGNVDYVNKTAKRVIDMFPEDAVRMLGIKAGRSAGISDDNFANSDQFEQVDFLEAMNGNAKQLKKTDDLKNNGVTVQTGN